MNIILYKLCLENIDLSFKINKLDSIVYTVINKIISRSEIGFYKYKTNMDRTDLTIVQWIDHSIKEKIDDIIYMEKIKKELIDNNSIITYDNNKDSIFDNYFVNDFTKYVIYMAIVIPVYIDIYYRVFVL